MALIQGKEVKKTPKQEPANPKLWNMVTAQAGAKFSKNSPARGHWIHARYLQLGGKFVPTKKDVDPRFRDYANEEKEKKEKEAKKKVTKPIGQNLTRGERFR
jgi:hypothetical protein